MPDEIDEIGPAVRRRQLGRMLKDFRVAAGFTSIQAAAESTGFSRATVSRIEGAKQVILPRTVRILCQAYGIGAPTLDHMLRLAEESEERGWMLAYSDTVPDYFERYLGEEGDATEIWAYEVQSLPGPLQTVEYCRIVSAVTEPEITAEDLERRVELRQTRQQRLTERTGQRFIAVVDEGALHRQVGGPDVMREALLHLRTMAQLPNVELQVLPFAAGAHPGVTGSFWMLHFPPAVGDPTLYVEFDSGAVYPDRPLDFERYTWKFNRLREIALPARATHDLLSKLAGDENPGE